MTFPISLVAMRLGSGLPGEGSEMALAGVSSSPVPPVASLGLHRVGKVIHTFTDGSELGQLRCRVSEVTGEFSHKKKV
jgi:hypothetical protein